MGSRESGVGECGIINLDFIIPMQPETILAVNPTEVVRALKVGIGAALVIQI